MPICERCGRALAENEICTCTPQPQIPNPEPQGVPDPSQGFQAQPDQPYGQPYPDQSFQGQPNQPYGQPYPNQNFQGQPNQPYGQPYPNQNFQGQPNQPYGQPYGSPYNYNMQPGQQQQKKFPVGCIIAIVVALVSVPVVGVLAAILVPAMMGYMKKSNVSSMRAEARSIVSAVNTVIVDHEAEAGENESISGIYIISSDDYMCDYVPYDIEDMREAIAKYVDTADHTYFAVVENGACTYAAVYDEKAIGTYPGGDSMLAVYYDGTTADKDTEFDDLYYNAYGSALDDPAHLTGGYDYFDDYGDDDDYFGFGGDDFFGDGYFS